MFVDVEQAATVGGEPDCLQSQLISVADATCRVQDSFGSHDFTTGTMRLNPVGFRNSHRSDFLAEVHNDAGVEHAIQQALLQFIIEKIKDVGPRVDESDLDS